MIDQAEKLRKIMQSRDIRNEREPLTENKAKVIAISSGKGGVGKTNFAINFSISLRRLGYEVVVIDADIGLSNIEILAGLNVNNTISDIIFSDKDIFEIMTDGPEGIKIISGGSGLKELRLLKDDNFPKLIQEIEKLQTATDYIIIDTGAGISNSVTDFIMTSNELIVICTPDPTSLMDSYTLIKSINYSGFAGKINVVCNLVNNRNEGKEIYDKLSNAANNFLRVQINYLGYIEKNDLVNFAVRNQIPFIISHPNSPISKRINIMAMGFLGNESLKTESDKTSFAKRILDVFFKRGD
ncbi:ATP-binding protein [Tissierella sp. P1]|jgi:flagellar biosynthesis protein FlhG|uniref:MinD/ParA family protein n=1 Tax=Tissierella TaxID=41273 RepID=UPI000B9FAF4D|nr:MinD/ParA family protein [Tissierella sp. P1]MDU5079898.1 MinD/ParA family protein [Bacillota bacterium]OZV12921.1 ATP-binding protein [Tissierella sp. P1]